ncbi:hypothetical protein JZ751_001253 [Albula glossodonta]|uniref:Uncharacterized protein n=1 Tax=Albula glossodonta TaxID=121402 RepID=A0A8T2PSZ4_9TELE|nr:hypothetical protein JZ751_001253 [Albula glossodonta]
MTDRPPLAEKAMSESYARLRYRDTSLLIWQQQQTDLERAPPTNYLSRSQTTRYSQYGNQAVIVRDKSKIGASPDTGQHKPCHLTPPHSDSTPIRSPPPWLHQHRSEEDPQDQSESLLSELEPLELLLPVSEEELLPLRRDGPPACADPAFSVGRKKTASNMATATQTPAPMLSKHTNFSHQPNVPSPNCPFAPSNLIQNIPAPSPERNCKNS